MCHVAVWAIDMAMADPPHGHRFQRWAHIATAAFPQYRVTVRHGFDIFFKVWAGAAMAHVTVAPQCTDAFSHVLRAAPIRLPIMRDRDRTPLSFN